MSDVSWLNPTPHAIAVYASQPLSPVATQHSLPSGRYSLTWAGLAPAGSHQLCLAHLFDHLVGDQLHRVGNGNAESGCGSHIDDELELRRLLHGQVAGLLTLENPPGINARAAIRIRLAGSIAHQPSRHGKLAIRVV